ncbi:MAG: histidine kinase [Lacunisphaera sp.]
MRQLNAPAWQVALTFGLGAIYGMLGVLHTSFTNWRPRLAMPLYLGMGAIATALVFVSPIKGFFGIILLPMVSMGIFDFPRAWAIVNGLYFFAVSVGVFWWEFGARAIPEAIMSYLAAFAFTAVFTNITKQALDARNRAQALQHELEQANEQLRVYATQAEELATTRERNRVAREIHDGVGHYLTVVKTQLDAAAALMPTRPDEARTAVQKAAKLTAEALDDVRRSVGALRTDVARPPLPEALRELVAHGEPVPTLSIEGAPRPLAPGIEHALYRAAQEGPDQHPQARPRQQRARAPGFSHAVAHRARIVRQWHRHDRRRQRLRPPGPAGAHRSHRRQLRSRQPPRGRVCAAGGSAGVTRLRSILAY